MSSPQVTIGMPVFNGERYLRVAVDSILNQTLRDLELIICDNCSTDGTEVMCREYAARDARVRYIRHSSNIGGSQNFRSVFAFARAPLFKWLAVDDYCGPEFLERCKRILDKSPGTVLCTTKVMMIDEEGTPQGLYVPRQDLPQLRPSERLMARVDEMSNAVYGLMRTEVMRETGLIGDYVGSDEVFLAEMGLRGCFAELPETLLYRRRHPGAFSWEVTHEKVKDFFAPSETKATHLVFRDWRHLAEYFRAVQRARLSFRERARTLFYFLRIAWWRRRNLADEVMAAIRHTIRRDPGAG